MKHEKLDVASTDWAELTDMRLVPHDPKSDPGACQGIKMLKNESARIPTKPTP
jgi:hypothetical protein